MPEEHEENETMTDRTRCKECLRLYDDDIKKAGNRNLCTECHKAERAAARQRNSPLAQTRKRSKTAGSIRESQSAALHKRREKLLDMYAENAAKKMPLDYRPDFLSPDYRERGEP